MLVDVDLRHTKLQRIDREAFDKYSELKSMLIPDSLEADFGLICREVFPKCFNLAPYYIIGANCRPPIVIAYIHSQKLPKDSKSAPASPEDFLSTANFRRLLVELVPSDFC